jgi:hypothetical protein
MKRRRLKFFVALVLFGCGSLMFFQNALPSSIHAEVIAQTHSTPTPAAPGFDQKAALAKLREEIKGKEREPAETVFKNIQTLKGVPAGRILAIMEMGYSRSLGVDCTHCHVPDKWESEEKQTKQITRGMVDMAGKINTTLLKGIKNIGANAVVNCTTCHRGQVTPAIDMTPKPPARAENSSTDKR